jgi:hypothetical protein
VIKLNLINANARNVSVQMKTNKEELIETVHDCEIGACHCYYDTADYCDCCEEGLCDCDDCSICEELSEKDKT